MSVDRTSYLLYGFLFEKEEEMDIIDDEHYEDLMEEEPYSSIFNNSNSKQIAVFDCMCGQYIYIGIKLAELDEYDDDCVCEIDEDRINGLKEELKSYIEKWPDYLVDLCKDKTPKLYFFIHAY